MVHCRLRQPTRQMSCHRSGEDGILPSKAIYGQGMGEVMRETGKNEVAHPHDLLVRNVLADAKLVADLLQHYLEPELVSTLELDSLKRDAGDAVSSNLSKSDGDLRYSARFKGNGGELRVLLLLEHRVPQQAA